MKHTDGQLSIVEEYGYANGMELCGECELYDIEVLPEFRGRGKGYELLQRFLAECDGDVFLEVATRNTPAVKLYEKCGFVEIYRRKNYYKDDDAIVMKREGK
jgi:ribosomal-protein-alanine N-acetyltransferase